MSRRPLLVRPTGREIRQLLTDALSVLAPGVRPEIGPITLLRETSFRATFVARVRVSRDQSGLSDDYVVRATKRSGDGWLPLEAVLTSELCTVEPPFHVPAVVALVPFRSGLASLRRFVRGVACPMQPDPRTGVSEPWAILGALAARIHAIDAARVLAVLPRQPTTATTARGALASLEGGAPGTAARPLRLAHDWARANVGADPASVLVHGDLADENVLLRPGMSAAVIGWDRASFGDPAYDLAVLTAGEPQPFGDVQGREKLLDAYRRAGGRDVPPSSVRLFELLILARRYEWAVANRRSPAWAAEADRLADRIVALTDA